MKYWIDFQPMRKEGGRPIDDGPAVPIEVDEKQFALIPSVGDYVHVHNLESKVQFSGKVRSRLFRYIGTGDTCGINIVVQDEDDDWGLLIKE